MCCAFFHTLFFLLFSFYFRIIRSISRSILHSVSVYIYIYTMCIAFVSASPLLLPPGSCTRIRQFYFYFNTNFNGFSRLPSYLPNDIDFYSRPPSNIHIDLAPIVFRSLTLFFCAQAVCPLLYIYTHYALFYTVDRRICVHNLSWLCTNFLYIYFIALYIRIYLYTRSHHQAIVLCKIYVHIFSPNNNTDCNMNI